MDLYDAMIDSIQQFPLDSNLFERNILKLNKKYKYAMKKYKRCLKKGLSYTNKEFEDTEKILKKCIKKKRKLIKIYKDVIQTQLNNLNELSRINNMAISFPENKLTEGLSKAAIMKIPGDATLENNYCICNTKEGGTMICCDIPDCLIRWYHCKCVNVNAIPNNEWVCDRCKKKS